MVSTANPDDAKLNNCDISIVFSDLLSHSPEIPDICNTWSLDWKMSYEDIAVTVGVDKEIDLFGYDVKVKSIEISPFSISFNFYDNYSSAETPEITRMISDAFFVADNDTALSTGDLIINF